MITLPKHYFWFYRSVVAKAEMEEVLTWVNADILRGPAMIAILQKHLLLQIKYYRIVLLGSDKRHSQRPHKFELCPRGL